MVASGTVASILKKHGIEPSPQRNRQASWKEFLSRHWELLVAADFFIVEVWTCRGLARFLVLFFIDFPADTTSDGRRLRSSIAIRRLMRGYAERHYFKADSAGDSRIGRRA